ncbi:Protein-arginine deiminase type-3 [Tupaia chinensis]|uniref:Protein-arginine deiminase type-3 n=1 Tax=Tupaia chinensis TaxID=246437 RepID=L9L0V3_TUPCH|nr:Protein-arginine deiminase type-3 [Tupaia chinensis]
MSLQRIVRVSLEHPTSVVCVAGVETLVDIYGSVPEGTEMFEVYGTPGVDIYVSPSVERRRERADTRRWHFDAGQEIIVVMNSPSNHLDDSHVQISYHSSHEPLPLAYAVLYLTCIDMALECDLNYEGREDRCFVDKRQWVWGPGGYGAVLLVNCDRDDQSCDDRDNCDQHVRCLQGPEDSCEAYRHVLGQDKVSYEVPRFHGDEERFFVEGLSFPDAGFTGLVSFHVTLLDGSNEDFSESPIFTDTVVFRVAPWIMTPSILPPLEVYVCRVRNNQCFVDAVAELAEKAGCKLTICPQVENRNDRWIQDEMELGYVQAPHKTFPVVFDSPRNGELQDFPYRRILVSGPDQPSPERHGATALGSQGTEYREQSRNFILQGKIRDASALSVSEGGTQRHSLVLLLIMRIVTVKVIPANQDPLEERRGLPCAVENGGPSTLRSDRRELRAQRIPPGAPPPTDSASPCQGPDFGYVTREPRDRSVSGLDSFGNLEVSPPVVANGKEYPLGRILIGGNLPGSRGRRVTQVVRDFLHAQKVQPLVELFVDWLAVGHVDEFLTFVPAPDRKGFRMLLASPGACFKLFQEKQKWGHGKALLFEGVVGDERVTTISINQVLSNKNLISYNKFVQGCIDWNREVLKRELGLADRDIIDVPQLFKSERKKAVAFFPDLVNMLVLGTHLGIPKPFGPIINGRCCLEEQVRSLLEPLGLHCTFIDDFTPYHMLHGEVHCGTNVRRQPFAFKWWNMVP